MQPLPDEQRLVLKAQQGDEHAITTLYRGYVQAIYRYISFRVESDMVAEDLTADVFLRMVQGLPTYRLGASPFAAWLFRIASSRVVDHYRKSRRFAAEPISDDLASEDADLSTSLAEEEERSQVRRVFQQLPEDYQTLLILRFIEHMPHAEVATLMGRSELAIRSMQHRALKSLAKSLGTVKVRSYLRGEEV